MLSIFTSYSNLSKIKIKDYTSFPSLVLSQGLGRKFQRGPEYSDPPQRGGSSPAFL